MCVYSRALLNCISDLMMYHFAERVYILVPTIFNIERKKEILVFQLASKKAERKKKKTITGKMSKVRKSGNTIVTDGKEIK